MAHILISAPADADTAEIIAYLAAKAGVHVAARYTASLEKLYDRLAVHPQIGAPRPALGPYVRSAIVPPYTVIYEHAEPEGAVTILRIVHGRRKITGKLLSASISSS